VTPLDTCARVRLDGVRYARLRASADPLVRTLLENYRLWCPHASWCAPDNPVETRSTTLFDTVAVYLAFSQALVRVETIGVAVSDSGMTLADPTARPLRWATSWKDLDGFRDLLTERLLGTARAR
jgi:hypothetical protein